MVSVAHSPHVRGKPPPATGREPGKEKKTKVAEKTLQNGGLPHLVLVKTPHPKGAAFVRASSPPPINNNSSASDDASDAHRVVRTAIRTQAQPTGNEGGEGGGGTTCCGDSREEGGRSVCPQAALSYTSAILTSRAKKVLRQQESLDDRLRRLHSRVRGRQGRGVCRHVQSQISYAASVGGEGGEERERPPVKRAASIPMQVDGAVEEVSVDRISVARSLNFGSRGDSDQSKRDTSQPIDVVGNSTGAPSDEPNLEGVLRSANPRGNLLGNRSSEFGGKSEVVERWRQQLRGSCVGMGGGRGEIGESACGGEVTDTSSDEEGTAECPDTRQRRSADFLLSILHT